MDTDNCKTKLYKQNYTNTMDEGVDCAGERSRTVDEFTIENINATKISST